MSEIENPARTTKTEKYTDLRAKWSVYYYILGDPDKAIELAGYVGNTTIDRLVTWYKQLDLPEPCSTTGALIDAVFSKLTTDQLADIIVESTRAGKDNRMAQALIDLHIERERQEKTLRFRNLDISERFSTLRQDEDFMTVCAAWGAREQVTERLIYTKEYWSQIDRDSLLEVKSLIDKVLGINAYGDKRELSGESEGKIDD